MALVRSRGSVVRGGTIGRLDTNSGARRILPGAEVRETEQRDAAPAFSPSGAVLFFERRTADDQEVAAACAHEDVGEAVAIDVAHGNTAGDC